MKKTWKQVVGLSIFIFENTDSSPADLLLVLRCATQSPSGPEDSFPQPLSVASSAFTCHLSETGQLMDVKGHSPMQLAASPTLMAVLTSECPVRSAEAFPCAFLLPSLSS